MFFLVSFSFLSSTFRRGYCIRSKQYDYIFLLVKMVVLRKYCLPAQMAKATAAAVGSPAAAVGPLEQNAGLRVVSGFGVTLNPKP